MKKNFKEVFITVKLFLNQDLEFRPSEMLNRFSRKFETSNPSIIST